MSTLSFIGKKPYLPTLAKLVNDRLMHSASPPQTYTGHGQHFSLFFTLASGLTTSDMEHDGASNFAAWLLDDQGNHVDLLANEIGNFDGRIA
jgi:hypothetical protein